MSKSAWLFGGLMLGVSLASVQAEPLARDYHPERLIVTFAPGIERLQAQSTQAESTGPLQQQLQQARRFSQFTDQAVVRRPAGVSLQQAQAELQAMPGVRSVELDYKVRKTQQPNDPRYSQQWYLQALPGIQAEGAWAESTGNQQLVVAVIDTGVDYNHPDLVANIWQNPLEQANGQDDSGNGYIDDIRGIDTANDSSDPMDDDGHGTLIAGIIAAAGNNNRGIAGVNWQLQILPCKFLDDLGEGFTSDAIECLDYILDLKVNHGIPIVATNNSWGSPSFSSALYQAVQKHHDAGILFVASAGNSASSLPFYPAAFDLPNVISVAAHDRDGQLADFSNFGRGHVSLSAPGVQMLSTYLDNGYASSSGTSMAAPVVTGLAALLKSARPDLDTQGLKHHLLVEGAAANDSRIERYTMTGQMALAADGNGGAFNCTSQQLFRRLKPSTDSVYLAPDSWLDIQLLGINCLGSAPVADIAVVPGDEFIELRDDGNGQDRFAGDGIHSGRWWFDGTAATLQFPDGEVRVETQQANFCAEQNVSAVPQASCDALVAFFYQTEGPGWFERSGWLQHSSVCDWYGVSCQQGDITALELAQNNLNGDLQLDFGVLPMLTVLDLAGNSLTGAIPASIEAASRLQQLDLSKNGFSGALPAALGQLSALQQLVLADNFFSGSLPSVVGSLTNLNWLDLSDNNLQGTLPSSLTQLSQLQGFSYLDTRLCEPRNSNYYQWLQAISFLDVNPDCPNQAPVVSAGENRTVSAGSQVQLQGSASDADGEILHYSWLQIAGPTVQLSNPETLQASFISPVSAQTQTLRFRLTASDLRTSSSAEVSITVQPQAGGSGSTSTSGGALLWLLPAWALLMIGRCRRNRVYSAASL
ncbi:S8 family peptidase [Alkalimonas amylolytica]|uniref:Leucine rich repeat-containing protein n=1 Tax=Alkalimonas amylolytica TaxID=152573 RepID=A0A1H4CIE8_ALKAM|nr:S8 family peptidase [Alkalimonas amylolytica]SEA59842.1 Leucine rich repeat-containing protein [Alkalimonas amylolytica]